MQISPLKVLKNVNFQSCHWRIYNFHSAPLCTSFIVDIPCAYEWWLGSRRINRTRIEPVGKPYREVCLQTKLWPWKVHQPSSWSLCLSELALKLKRIFSLFLNGFFGVVLKRKRRRSDPVLWQKPLYQQKIRKPKDNTHKRHQKLRLHNNCGPT